MSTGTPSLVIIGAFLAGAAVSWAVRGWWDGSTISAEDAQESAQAAIDQAIKSASKIERAQSVADAARRAASKSIEVQNVDKTCPPGAGAVSDDLTNELRAAFGAKAETADPP